jgi:predicted permease
MDTLAAEIRQALRQARRHPGAAAAVALTLALGIGASTAIFSLVHAVVLRALPFEHAARLLWIGSRRPQGSEWPFSLPEYIDYRDQVRALDRLVAYAPWSTSLTGRGYAERLQGLRLTANAFEALGVRPARGRLLEPADDGPGAPRVAVLGYDLWQRRFGADDGIIGQALRLDGEPYLVVGVLPRVFPVPQRDVEIVVPLAPDRDPKRDIRGSDSTLRFVGRLAAGSDAAAAATELDAIAAQLRQRFPVEYARKLGVRVAPLQDQVVGDSRRMLLLVLAAVLLVLGIACGNMATLLLARAVDRRREIAVRVALGASRAAILRQFVVESALPALAGGAGGVLVAAIGLRLLVWMAPPSLPRLSEATLDGGVLAFAAVLTLAMALLAGVAPAGRTFGSGIAEGLVSVRLPLGSAGRHRWRRRLIVAEIAAATSLAVGSVLVAASLWRLQHLDPGFATRDVLVARVSLPRASYARREQLVGFHDRFRERLLGLPGVRGAGIVSVAPLSGSGASTQFTVEGRPPAAPGQEPEVQFRLVSPGYVGAVGIRLLQGRNILDTDRDPAPPVALVNRTLADRFLGPSPLGAHLRLHDNSQGPRLVEVVGVVADVKQSALDAAPTNDVYLAWAQAHADHVPFLSSYQFWAVRTSGDPLALGESFRRELAALDPEGAASQLRSLQHYVDTSLAPRRFSVLLMGAFAAAALVLATTGLYALVAYSVSRRTEEIGLRLAVGARPLDIYRLVLGEALTLALLGSALGLGLSLLGQRAVAGLLFGISAGDVRVLLGVAALLTAAALAASFVPARRAARVDPLVSLRGE